MYLKKNYKWLALLGSLAIGAASWAQAAQDSAIIDTLVKKGIINDQEAKELQSEIAKEEPAGLGISPYLTKLTLSGDARVRYEYREGENASTGDREERNRYRYRLRVALTGELKDGWFFGTRLETSTSNRSTNVTAGSTTAPWDKTSNGIYLGQVYIGRHMGDLTVTAGRQPIPFDFSSMVIDDDLNPEGLSEQWKHQSGDVTWLANLGQFVYAGTDKTNNFGAGATNANTYLFVLQAGAKAKIGGGSLTVTPTYYGYSNSDKGATALTGTASSGNLQTTGLQVIDIPVSYGFKIGDLPAKVFGDFAYNADAKARAKAAGQSAYDNQDLACQIGFGVGQSKKPGDWEAKAFWQSVDAFALDSNLVDSDLFDGRTNMEGVVLQASYVLSQGVSVKFTYANADQKDSNLVTYGTGDITPATNVLKHFNLFQADLNVKF